MTKFSIFLSTFICLNVTAISDELKVGIVDMTRVFGEYYKTKDVEKEIEKKREIARSEVNERDGELKEKMNELKKIRAAIDESTHQGDASSSSGPLSGTNANKVLEAIEMLSTKMDRMALKSDLTDLQKQLEASTKVMISQAVDPTWPLSGRSPNSQPVAAATAR